MKTVATTVVILLLLSGAALLGYARWTRGLEEADAALAAGQFEQAIAGYDKADARFERTPAAKQLFRREYARASRNRLWALYQMKRYDDTIAAAERAPAEANPFFWSGCAFFIKARAEEKPEARIGWLARAEEQFRKAVDATPDDWDTKFNFELTTRLLAELRKQPKTPPTQLMQLLRPPTTGSKVQRRVG